MKRAYETEEHLQLKQQVAQYFKKHGYKTVFEHQCVDIIAFRSKSCSMIAIEIERSAKNLLNNLRRNHRNGFRDVLIVAPDRKRKERYQKILKNEPEKFSGVHVKCVSITELTHAKACPKI